METKQWPEKLQQSVQTTASNMDNGNNLLDNGDTLQDNSNNNEDKCNRNLQLQQDVQSFISDKGRQKIQAILDQVHTLVPTEKLLLYLQLPTENANNVDPLRQSLNPLGSRSEISQTITWIQTHLEEDKELSLQKKGVYDDYVRFCERNIIKPLSTADFGKVMKQVYPNVRPRRLGTRGQSKYCYSGLRNRVKLSAPLLPDLAEKPLSTEGHCTQTDLMTAAWIIIKEWVETQLSRQFKSSTSLAYYLVTELSVGVGSEAASLVTNAANVQIKDEPLAAFANFNRHRETTLQLQRKLQQKSEIIKDTKRKQLQSPRMEQKSRGKKTKLSASTSCNTSPVAANDSKSSPQSQEHSPVCDSTNLQTLPDFNRFQRPPNTSDPPLKDSGVVNQQGEYPIGKVAIPRITNAKQSPVLSPKRAKNNKYKAIQPKPELCDRASYNPKQALTVRDLRSQQDIGRRRFRKKESPSLITPEESRALFSRERLISIGQVSKNALDEYLGTSNSQEQEEEIMQYFGNNNDDQDKTNKISQLRQLLEKNQIASQIGMHLGMGEPKGIVKTNLKLAHKSIIPPNLQNLNAKRRVSFDTHVHEEPVPASPNTRRQNINFIPISPLSPNGVQSKCSSTNASPFVSPRNTPIPRSRGNSHPYINTNNNMLNARSVPLQLPFKLKSDKTKKSELEITIPENEEKEYFKPQLTNLPMSAPPSPKTNYFFSKTLPSFQPQQNVGMCDSLSPEVGQLFTNSIPSNSLENALRSQSVPVNAANQFFNQYTFTNDQNTIAGEFNDIDFNNENINVNKIIDDIDQSNLDILNMNMSQNDFEPNSNIPIDENLALPIEPDVMCNQSSAQGTLRRSHSIDVEEIVSFPGLKLPSRSVPSTPIPYNPSLDMEPFSRNVINHSSKSYPSTPLTTETFTYNTGQDYLLNGQPIKDKLLGIGFMPQGESKQNMFEVYNDGDLIDNKNFNFEGQMAEGSFGAKQNINEGVDDFFKTVSD